MNHDHPTILCIACYFKGMRFLEACKREGVRVILITTDKLAEEPWPHEAIDEFIALPSVSKQPDITNTIAYLYRTRNISRIVALDEYDTITAAQVREHLYLDGTHVTQARKFRDKLTMRHTARKAGIAVPAFVGVHNYDAVNNFVDDVPAPWILKPRAEASAMGIRRVPSKEALWEMIDSLGDRQSHFLLEEFVEGTVHHVDSIVAEGTVLFSAANEYREPPLNVYADGGVFCTQTMRRDDDDTTRILSENEHLISSFGMKTGVVHAEFIKRTDGSYVFLEAAARVGGAGIDQLVEHASGLNLWEEWARLEVAQAMDRQYLLPEVKDDYAGLIVCLSKVQHPDLSTYSEPEIVFKMKKDYHAGVIVSSPLRSRVDELLHSITNRFATDFLTTQPPLESAPEA